MTETPADYPIEKRADIQGLRGIAVLSVLIYHASGALLPGGFAGVDIFFVLSGYLITQILLEALDSDRFSLREFYQRRIRRLFPALYAMMAVTLLAGLIFLPPKLLSELVFTQFFTTLFLSNFAFAHLTDYFDTAASLKPLLHTWSLGVEEQFYLVYPVVLMTVHRFFKKALWLILSGLMTGSLVLAYFAVQHHPETAFYLPLPRAFELLIGALCVGLQPHIVLSDMLKRGVSQVALLGLAASLFFINDTLPFPGPWALIPCLATAALLVTQNAHGNRLLSVPLLAQVGDMSYSLYLWHWPVLVFARIVLGDSLWVALGALVMAFVMSIASRRYIEEPFLALGHRLSERRIWSAQTIWRAGASVMTASLIVCLAIYAARGLPWRFSAAEQTAFNAADDYSHDRKTCHLGKDARRDYSRTCVFGDSQVAPAIAVWGDSEGAEFSQALGDQLMLRQMSLRQITASACPPSIGYDIAYNAGCRAHNTDMLAHLKTDPYITTVILIANYTRYEKEGQGAMLGGLELSALDLQASGKRVVIVYPLPAYDFDPPSQVGLSMRLHLDPTRIGMTRSAYEHTHSRVRNELGNFARSHNIAVLDPAAVFCDAKRCHVYDPKAGVLYFNDTHLSLSGAALLAAKFELPAPVPVIVPVGPEPSEDEATSEAQSLSAE